MISDETQYKIGGWFGKLFAWMGWAPVFSWDDVIALIIIKVGGTLLLAWLVMFAFALIDDPMSYLTSVVLAIVLRLALAVLERTR